MAIYTADRLRHVAPTLFVGAGASEPEARPIAHSSVAADRASGASHFQPPPDSPPSTLRALADSPSAHRPESFLLRGARDRC